jgi:hypothetical protein
MDGLEVRMDRVEVKLARVDGRTLEAEYRQKAPAYFGRWLKGAEVLGSNEIRDRVEAHLSEDELHDVLLLDMVVRGRASKQPSQPEVWLAVEVSSVVDREDVARAVRRTDLLRRAGLPAVPVVAGEHITEGGEAEVQRHHVALLQDGGAQFWSEAIAAWPLP